MAFQNLYAKPSEQVPLIYEKLTSLCERSDELFTGFKYSELLDGRHYVEAIIGDKYFIHVSAETKVQARDELALKIYQHYGVKNPMKDPAANLIAQTNMLAFWNPLSIAQEFLADRLVITFAGETDLTYKLEAKYIPPFDDANNNPKRQKQEILVGEGYGCSAASASYKIGVTVLKSEKFREAYIKWVKSGKKGCFEEVDTEEMKKEVCNELKTWTKIDKCELTESKVLHDLKILCEAYELEEPEYFKQVDEKTNDTDYLCSVSSISKNEKLETACLQSFEHLKHICACRDRLVAEKVAKQERERLAEMQSKVLAAEQRRQEHLDSIQKKAKDREDRKLKHLQWLQECADKKRKKLENQFRSCIERKRKQMLYDGKEMDVETEAQLMIDLECGISETKVLEKSYVPGSVTDISMLREREARKKEARARHEAILEQHRQIREMNEAKRKEQQDIFNQRRFEKEQRKIAHEAEKMKKASSVDNKAFQVFEYVCEYDGQPVFTSESISKAYANEITHNPIIEINELVENMFAGYQKAELEVTQLENRYSNAGTYYEAKIDTLRTIAFGRQAKDARRVALQALVLTIKNGGELDDGFVDQLKERDVLAGGNQSQVHKSHPVHQLNVAKGYFKVEVSYKLDVEQPRWTMVCRFGDLVAIGHDETKQLAKQKSAEEMLPLVIEKYGSLEEAAFLAKKRANLKMSNARKARKMQQRREMEIAANTSLS